MCMNVYLCIVCCVKSEKRSFERVLFPGLGLVFLQRVKGFDIIPFHTVAFKSVVVEDFLVKVELVVGGLHDLGLEVAHGLLARGLGVGQRLDEVFQGERPRLDGAHGRGIPPLRLQELPDGEVGGVRAQLLQVAAAVPGGPVPEPLDALAHVEGLVHHLPLQHLGQDGLPLVPVGEAHQEGLRQPPQHRLVHLPGPVRGAQHHHLRVLVRREPVPQRHELRLHVVHRLVLVRVPLPKQRVDLVDEDDRGLQLHRQREDRRHQLLGVAEPLALQRRRAHVDEAGV
mmetsp:Transcript_9191/g.22735  ORF Transcript_9191/g.22735 Transcript_9191/m.22735 type:complete len:284 (-) Transcript_9191:523-1374(-)